MSPRPCAAYREGDQMRCATCRLLWDIGDEKPVCRSSALTPRPKSIPFKSMGPNITLGRRRPDYLRK